MKRKIKGFTLIESMLVAGFVALASVGIYNIFNKAQAISIANDEAKMVSKFAKDIIDMYQASSSYAGLDNSVLNLARVTPGYMIDPSDINNIINKFGGNVYVGPFDYGGMTDVGFSIKYSGLSVASCAPMIMALATEFDKIEVNGSYVKFFDNITLTPSSVTTACNSNGGNPVPVAFLYISTFQTATAAAVPPEAPRSGTQFSMADSDAICDISSPGFWLGEPSYPNPPPNGIGVIPANVRNLLISTYRTIDNYAGRCPELTGYSNLLNLMNTHKAANPTLNYMDVYTNIVEPLIISSGTTAFYSASVSSANSLCNAQSGNVFRTSVTIPGSQVPSSYIPYSGNKCKVN